MTGQFARREVSISWSSMRRRVRGEGMSERGVGEDAGCLPLGDPIDMVLQVDDAEEEGHGAAQGKSNVFFGVVILLHGGPDFENADDIGNDTRENEGEAQISKALFACSGTSANCENASNKSSRVHRDENHRDGVVDETTGPVCKNQTPDPGKQY